MDGHQRNARGSAGGAAAAAPPQVDMVVTEMTEEPQVSR